MSHSFTYKGAIPLDKLEEMDKDIIDIDDEALPNRKRLREFSEDEEEEREVKKVKLVDKESNKNKINKKDTKVEVKNESDSSIDEEDLQFLDNMPCSKYIRLEEDDENDRKLKEKLKVALYTTNTLQRSLSKSELPNISEPTERESITLKIDTKGKNGTLKLPANKNQPLKFVLKVISNIISKPEDKIVLKMDGIALSLDKTPEEYSMMDGDLIQVTEPVPKAVTPAKQKVAILDDDDNVDKSEIKVDEKELMREIEEGLKEKEEIEEKLMKITVRTATEKFKFKIREDDPLKNLIQKVSQKMKLNENEYIVLQFDGDNLDPENSAIDSDLESGDLLDAVVKNHENDKTKSIHSPPKHIAINKSSIVNLDDDDEEESSENSDEDN